MLWRSRLLAAVCAALLIGGCDTPAAPAAGGPEAVLGAQARQGGPSAADLPTGAPEGGATQDPAAPRPDDTVPGPDQLVQVPPPTDASPPGDAAGQPTVEQLCAEIRDMVERRGRERSLLATLGCEGGNPRAQLRAFINHVEAQRGKGLPAEDADRLLALARALEGGG